MKIVSWTLTVLAALAAALFAVSNRGAVTLDLWPLPLTFDVPVYLLVFGALLTGFLIGGMISFLSGFKWRNRAGTLAREAEQAQRKATRMEARTRELEEEKARAASTPAGTTTALPPRNAA